MFVILYFRREFAERIILCNSLVWGCEETGKTGLTYVEALESEKNAKKLLNDFPTEVRTVDFVSSYILSRHLEDSLYSFPQKLKICTGSKCFMSRRRF